MPKSAIQFLALSLLMGVAFPALGAQSAAQDVRAAKELYKAFEYEVAVLRFEGLAVDDRLGPEGQAEMLLWAAMSHAGLGHADDAEDAIRRALDLHRAIEIPASAPPSIRELIDKVRLGLSPEMPEPETPVTEEMQEPAVEPSPEVNAESASNDLLFFIAGGGAGLVGLGAAIGAATMIAVAFETRSIREDKSALQSVVAQGQQDANGQLGVAYALLGLSVVGLAAGGALVALPLMGGE
jgi:hypothetical protein